MPRAIDVLLAGLLLLLSLPLTLLITIALLICSPGNPLFRQTRLGQGGRTFSLLKFRTMRNVSGGSGLTVGNDKRITGIGRVLRRVKFDEIPQLWNILCGQMRFVGPRPELPEYADSFSEEQRLILNYRPGVTDPASIKYRNESEILGRVTDPEKYYLEEILPDKIKISLEYQRRRTLATDLGVLAETLIAVFCSPARANG